MASEKIATAIAALAEVVNDESITLPEPGDRQLVLTTIGMLVEVQEADDES